MFIASKVSYSLSMGHISMLKSQRPGAKLWSRRSWFRSFFLLLASLFTLKWCSCSCGFLSPSQNLFSGNYWLMYFLLERAVFLAFTHKFPIFEVSVCSECLAQQWQDYVYQTLYNSILCCVIAENWRRCVYFMYFWINCFIPFCFKYKIYQWQN